MTTPLPAGFRVELDATSKQLRDGLWFGGSPPRVVRLTGRGRTAWAELQAHGVVDRQTGLLARRLVDAGIAHPVPPPAAGTWDVTVVVPAHERADDLDRCLVALGTARRVVVVDDASHDANQLAGVCAARGARLVRRAVNGGPGAARNTGLAHVLTPFVAFVDSDCVPPAGWLDALLAHFADPMVVAVAPRVTALASDSWAGRYTRERGSLDLGGRPAQIAPLTRVAYVPTAALVVRMAALAGPACFDETLRVGEDVDLVWRLHAAGGRVRYDPSVEVPHREPARWRELLARRFRYGTSAGPLARRHRGALTPLVMTPWPTLTVAAALARRPLWAAAAALTGMAALTRTLHAADVPTSGLLPAFARAVQQTLLGVGRYATQFGAPVLVAALPNRHTRFAAAALLVAGPLSDWWASQRRLDPLRYATGAIADEIAYGAGVWTGCVRARTAAPLRPVVVWRPLRIDARRS